MVISKNNATISVLIDKDIKLLLEQYCQEVDVTLSKFSRNLIYVALDNVHLLKKTGATKLIVPIRNILDSIPSYKERVDAEIANAEQNSVTMSVVIDSSVKELLEEIADEVGLPLKTFARNLIYVGLDDYKLLKRIGIIRIAVSFRNFLESFQSYDPNNADSVTNK